MCKSSKVPINFKIHNNYMVSNKIPIKIQINIVLLNNIIKCTLILALCISMLHVIGSQNYHANKVIHVSSRTSNNYIKTKGTAFASFKIPQSCDDD